MNTEESKNLNLAKQLRHQNTEAEAYGFISRAHRLKGYKFKDKDL